MPRILAVGSAALLAFTVTTAPLSAADLGMPMKAAPITAAPPAEVDWVPILLALLLAGLVASCVADWCQTTTTPSPQTTGGNNNNQVDNSPILRGLSGIREVAA
jgi:hypothetical protein